MQPTSRVVGAFEGANNPSSEPPDVFCGLASLIVEGRIPRNDGRGYGEGPHVPQTASKALTSRHECRDENNVVSKISLFSRGVSESEIFETLIFVLFHTDHSLKSILSDSSEFQDVSTVG